MRTDELINTLVADHAVQPRPKPVGYGLVMAIIGGLAVSLALFSLTLGVRPDILSALSTWRFDLKLSANLLLLIVSCCDGGGGRAARRRFGGSDFCHALHERLAAVCGDLVRASNRSHVYVWSIGREACAALVAGSWPALAPESLIGLRDRAHYGKESF